MSAIAPRTVCKRAKSLEDCVNTQVKEIFRGKVVNKSHTLNTGVDEFPRYVLEYLIDNYCAEESFHEDMEKVVRRLRETFNLRRGGRENPPLHP